MSIVSAVAVDLKKKQHRTFNKTMSLGQTQGFLKNISPNSPSQTNLSAQTNLPLRLVK